QYGAAYLALSCFACLGAIRLTNYHRPAANDIRNLVTDGRKLATIRGRIVTEPYVNEYHGWKFARFKHSDPSSSFYLKVSEVETTAGWAVATGTIRVRVGGPVEDLKSGDNIQAYCWLDRFQPPTNPGQFDTAGYLARRNVILGASVESRDGIKLLSGPPAAAWAGLRARVKQAATTALLGDLDPQDTNRGLLQALLLGERRDIDSDTYRAFRRTGLLHFISLSGMHMGILFGIIWWLCKTVGLMKPARAAICAIALGIFLLIVPPRAPTIRAAVICWVFCAAILFRRHSNPVNTLSLAVIILLLIRPTQLFEAGWQLSFACVLAIILSADRIEEFIRKIDRGTRLRFRVFAQAGSFAARLFASGLAAWLGGAGILLYHFHTINPLTSVWTVLVFPLVSMILVLGFLKMILFFPLPALSGLPGVAAASLSSALIWIVRLIAQLDISQILIGEVSLAPVVFYYCIVVFAGYVYFRRPLKKRFICTAMIVSLIVYLGAARWQGAYQDDLIVTCLDVGHGQAILVQIPHGDNVLFDAGSLHRSDIGTRIVAPFLDYRGIGKIDAIVVSHNDVDHINGIPEVVEHCKVGGVHANDAFFSGTDPWDTIKFLTECLAERGLEIGRLGTNMHMGSGTKVEILWPDEGVHGGDDLTDNNRSLVALIEFAGAKVLLCSDIEEYAQRQLLRTHADLKADVVVVPHHGSVRTLDATFLDKLNAKVLICSCDRTQHGRIVGDTESTMNASNEAKRLYTAEAGAITVVVGRDGAIKTATFAK
ncbi:MAG: DNA internalization-related competence protein ComEC/Rec2, partial [Planctomycetota bacterium]